MPKTNDELDRIASSIANAVQYGQTETARAIVRELLGETEKPVIVPDYDEEGA